MTHDYPIYIKWCKTLDYLMTLCEKFPKTVRFTLCDRLIKISLDILEFIVEAIYLKQKRLLLCNVNISLEKIRSLLQISVQRKYLSLSQYEYISREINEVGKMLGGWLKTCKE